MDLAGRLGDRDHALSPVSKLLLGDRVQETTRPGKLPDLSPERTWGGPGSGICCAICGERIRPDEVEFELEFATGDNGKRGQNYHVHVSCLSVWERQRSELKRAR